RRKRTCSSNTQNCPNTFGFETSSSLLNLWRADMMASSILTCQQYYRDIAEDMWYSMRRVRPAETAGSDNNIVRDRLRHFLNKLYEDILEDRREN
ncbi:unnamed protein product, partial [Aureobasidium pullulans]